MGIRRCENGHYYDDEKFFRCPYCGINIDLEDEIDSDQDKTVIIGRDPKISNIVLYGEKISRKHCEIVYDQNSGEYMVTDYSQNGVYLGNGKRLKKDTRTLVKRHSLLYIATPENSFILL